MKRNRRSSLIGLVSIGVFTTMIGLPVARAGPFADFFRSVKHAFTQPEPKQSSHHASTHKSATEHPSPAAAPSATTTEVKKNVNEPPAEKNTLVAQRVPEKAGAKADLQYGTPVPGKAGFVTSPYNPDGAYIDVRGIPPGTQVKDPSTGKLFRTP